MESAGGHDMEGGGRARARVATHESASTRGESESLSSPYRVPGVFSRRLRRAEEVLRQAGLNSSSFRC